jgi:effector-binding domain-containing protein
MQPTIREAPAATFLVSYHEVTIPQIPKVAERTVMPMIGAAQAAGLEMAGPLQFFFVGMTDDETPFRLGIALPMKEKGEIDGPYEWREVPSFPCLSVEYVGSMTGIGPAWNVLMGEMKAQGLQCAGEQREVYKHWVDFDSPENVTELQAGIVPA